MNGKKAKRLRKQTYGDLSLKDERKYIQIGGTIRNHPDSPRARYQATKRGRV